MMVSALAAVVVAAGCSRPPGRGKAPTLGRGKVLSYQETMGVTLGSSLVQVKSALGEPAEQADETLHTKGALRLTYRVRGDQGAEGWANFVFVGGVLKFTDVVTGTANRYDPAVSQTTLYQSREDGYLSRLGTPSRIVRDGVLNKSLLLYIISEGSMFEFRLAAGKRSEGDWLVEGKETTLAERHVRIVGSGRRNLGLEQAVRYEGCHLLLDASLNGKAEEVKKLLARGTDVNCRARTDGPICRKGFTPLLAAVSSKHSEAAQLLLKAGADVNLAGPDGLTALMLAAMNGDKKTVGLLIAAGADVNARARRGETALKIATNFQRHEVVETLRAVGAQGKPRPTERLESPPPRRIREEASATHEVTEADCEQVLEVCETFDRCIRNGAYTVLPFYLSKQMMQEARQKHARLRAIEYDGEFARIVYSSWRKGILRKYEARHPLKKARLAGKKLSGGKTVYDFEITARNGDTFFAPCVREEGQWKWYDYE